MTLARRARMITAILVVFLALITSQVGAYALSLYNEHRANQQWCAALTVLTQEKQNPPADPHADPSREESFLLYQDLVDLKHRFGCVTAASSGRP